LNSAAVPAVALRKQFSSDPAAVHPALTVVQLDVGGARKVDCFRMYHVPEQLLEALWTQVYPVSTATSSVHSAHEPSAMV
jgi:hypothetical protein